MDDSNLYLYKINIGIYPQFPGSDSLLGGL